MRNNSNRPTQKLPTVFDKVKLIFKDLSNFISKELTRFMYNLTGFILILELLLMAIGVIDFSWQKVGITSFIMFLLKSKDLNGIL